MTALIIVLRLIHILAGVYWAGTIFFFTTFLEPSLRSMGPDGGKVMVRFMERGYMKLMPAVAMTTVLSGIALLWIMSDGFKPAYMGSPMGIALSTGGALAIVSIVYGVSVLRPAGERIGKIAGELPQASEASKAALMSEMEKLRNKTAVGARIVFGMLVVAVALMAGGRYIGAL
jgi:uncharacterized membrane protein